MISTSKKFLFVHIPKTGGNSIRLVLAPHTVEEITFNESQEAFNQAQGEIHRFGIKNPHMDIKKHSTAEELRDKWDATQLGNWEDYFKFSIIRNPWERLVSYYFSPHLGRTEFDRDEFYEFLQSDIGRRQQTDYLLANKQLLMDKLIRYENLEQEFDNFCNQYSIEATIKETNQSTHRPYAEYYDERSLELVERFHGEDLAFLNYTFGD